MKRFLFKAAFFLFVLYVCYAQQETSVLHGGGEAPRYPQTLDNQSRSVNYGMTKYGSNEAGTPDQSVTKKNEGFFESGRTAFSLGVEASGAVANSYYNLTDVLSFSSFSINYRDMARSAPKDGHSFAGTGKMRVFLDIYLQRKYEFGVYGSADMLAFITLPKKLIEVAEAIASKSLPAGKAEATLSAQAFSFADIGAFYGMSIDSFKFRVNASYYMPLLYLDPHVGKYESFTDLSTGVVHVDSDIHLNVYTEKNFSKALQKGGLDLTFTGIYTFNPYVDLHFSFLHIPIVTAYMDSGYSAKFNLNTEKAFAGLGLMGDSVSAKENVKLQKKAVSRPLKVSTGLTIYPFANNYLIISPSIGLHCLTPFYIDAGLKLESRFLKVFGIYCSMTREDRIWKNGAGLFIDARVFRLETHAALAGTTFLSSFKARGAEAGIKLVVGY